MRPYLSTTKSIIKGKSMYTVYFNTFGTVFLILIIYFFYTIYIERKKINSF